MDEKIRRRAYYLYEERSGCNGTREGDWHAAVGEICGLYKEEGYRIIFEDSHWKALR